MSAKKLLPTSGCIRTRQIIYATIACAILTLSMTTTGCQKRPSEADCTKLLDHVIDIYAAAGGVDTKTKSVAKEVERQKSRIRDYLKAEVLKQCTTSRTTDYVACALKAKDSDALAACEVD